MGLEEFLYNESSGEGGMSAEALEAFKEQMRKNAAFIQAIKKDEKKQKDKEDQLVKILLAFIKTSSKKSLLLLISRLLEENIPAAFILSLVYLGNPEIEEEIKILAIEPHIDVKDEIPKIKDESIIPFNVVDEVLPLKVKIEIDSWIKNIWSSASLYKRKLFETSLDKNGEMKDCVVQTSAFVLRDFLANSAIKNEYDRLEEFCKFFLNGIVKKINKE